MRCTKKVGHQNKSHERTRELPSEGASAPEGEL